MAPKMQCCLRWQHDFVGDAASATYLSPAPKLVGHTE
jgi:hypothetical protein